MNWSMADVAQATIAVRPVIASVLNYLSYSKGKVNRKKEKKTGNVDVDSITKKVKALDRIPIFPGKYYHKGAKMSSKKQPERKGCSR